MTKDEILLAQREFLFPSLFHYYREPLVISRAKDQYVWDADGNQYLDFFGGILCVSVGHSNEFVTRRVHDQIDRLVHCSTVYQYEPQAALARHLARISPGGALAKSYFTNSGTEANETAFVAARCYTGNTEIVALRFSYHGRTAQAMAATGQSVWRQPGSQQSGFTFAHDAYCYRCPFKLSYPACDMACARDVEELIKTTTSGRVAGFIAEPIQGTAGFVTPPKEYFQVVAEIVRRHGGVFISDEVQTGWGRTGGKWFGIEQYGVTPDILTSAKGLANGFPIGLTMARPEIADSIRGVNISTFGGNPVSTTAAKAVIEFIEEKSLRANAAETGAYLRASLEELARRHALIGDVRGMGLMQGIELVRDRGTKEPAAAETALVMEAARAERLLIGKGGMYGNCLRVSPPLNIGRGDVDEFIRRLDAALTAAEAAAQ